MNNTTETIVTTIDFLRKAKHVLPTAEEIMQLDNWRTSLMVTSRYQLSR